MKKQITDQDMFKEAARRVYSPKFMDEMAHRARLRWEWFVFLSDDKTPVEQRYIPSHAIPFGETSLPKEAAEIAMRGENVVLGNPDHPNDGDIVHIRVMWWNVRGENVEQGEARYHCRGSLADAAKVYAL
jgi:hypothetical protein